MKRLFIYMLAAAAFAACSDDKLEPSKDAALITFPQGNTEYDEEILDIYNTYGTQILYDYNDAMLRWNITDRFSFFSTPANKEEDAEYIMNAVDFIRLNLFKFYSDDSLRIMLPYRIYLASQLKENPYETHDTIPNIAARNGYRCICFGVTNNRLNTMSLDSLRLTKGELHASLIDHCVDMNIIKVPETFSSLYKENVNWDNTNGASGYNNFGFLEYQNGKTLTPQKDFRSYIKYLCAFPKDEFKLLFESSTFDTSKTIAKKAKIVREWMLSEYGINVEAIAEDVPLAVTPF